MDRSINRALLVVVAKQPLPGKVKTRLSPQITLDDAAALYRCMLDDRLEEVGRLEGIDLAIAFTPAGARDAFLPLARNGIALFAQRGGDLGERLHNIFIDTLSAGYQAVSIIDSDSPDLPAATVAESFRLLLAKEADVVLGPCHDGGYYLVGMCQPHPELFTGIQWSTAEVLPATLKKAAGIGVTTELLSWWNDLDTFEDLVVYYKKYQGEINVNRRGGKTQAFLSALKSINEACTITD